MKQNETQEMREKRIKGLIDFMGHYVVMKEVDKNQKVWWIWSDGAVTNEGFKRDLLYNILFIIVDTYRHHRKLIKFTFVCLVMFLAYLIIF